MMASVLHELASKENGAYSGGELNVTESTSVLESLARPPRVEDDSILFDSISGIPRMRVRGTYRREERLDGGFVVGFREVRHIEARFPSDVDCDFTVVDLLLVLRLSSQYVFLYPNHELLRLTGEEWSSPCS
jgi:hypothetical protein